MKVNHLLILGLFFLWACENELPPEPPMQEPQDPFEVEGFLPSDWLDAYVISERLIYLGINGRSNGNSIKVFDTETEKLVQTIQIDPSNFKFLGKSQDKLYVSGNTRQSNGEFRGSIKVLDLQGQLLAEYSSENSCLPDGYEFTDLQEVDESGNVWLDMLDLDEILGNPPFGPELGLIQFNPVNNTCTYWEENNSNIPGNIIRQFKPYKDKLFLSARSETDSMFSLSVLDQGSFNLLKEAEPEYSIIEHLQIDADGLFYYVQRGDSGQKLVQADGSLIATGLDDRYTQGNMRYWIDDEQNTYVLGTAWVELQYSNYEPENTPFAFFSRNEEELVDFTTSFQPFVGQSVYGEIHQFSGDSDVLWVIGGNSDGLILKLTFNE